MVQVASQKSGHLKLKIFLGVIALLVAGYFVYKYSYIYLERRKYDKATVVIQKVADDLRAQGVQTTPYTECTRAQAKFNTEWISCYTGLTYDGVESDIGIADTLKKFINSMKLRDFTLINSGGVNPTGNPIETGTSVYRLKQSELQCRLIYSKEDENAPDYQLNLECGEHAQFVIF